MKLKQSTHQREVSKTLENKKEIRDIVQVKPEQIHTKKHTQMSTGDGAPCLYTKSVEIRLFSVIWQHASENTKYCVIE